MRRRVALGFLGVLLAGGAGYLSLSIDEPGSIGPGRYRDGRGRLGRGGAPRGGASCISVTGTAINYATYSQEFDNAAWTSFADVTAPTVTPNAAVAAPSCATTFNIAGCGQTGVVDRVQFPATGLTHFSGIRNIYSGPGGGGQWSSYVYAIAGPGGCPDGLDIGSSDADYWFTTTAVGASWVRISDLAGASTGAGSTLFIGNLSPAARPSATLGAVARSACDVYLFQADAHVQGDEQRPVKTTSAAATQGPGCY